MGNWKGDDKMSILALRQDVNELCNYNTTFVNQDNAPDYYLSAESPANIFDGNEIYILNSLGNDEKIQAEAHELGHLYVSARGIVKCAIDNSEPIDFLKLELNNALSHKVLMEIIENDYGISNDFHKNLRISGLSHLDDINDLEIELLYGIGLRLYDISRTIENTSQTVNQILSANEAVRIAYNLAYELLNDIEINTPRDEQIERIANYINILGLSRTDFNFI